MRKTDREQAPFIGEATSTAAAASETKPSPMMAQYLAIKAAHPDALLFYRMGDFYELFFADAEQAAKALGIVLTRRGKHEGADIPMCGVPVERHEDYLHRLIRAGFRVAICEQTEDPALARKRGGKSVVERAVVRLVTPGTLSEERLLDPARSNWLLALTRGKSLEGTSCYGLAALDMSTGAFEVCDVGPAGLASEIDRIDPTEIVLSDALADTADLRPLLAAARAPLTRIGREPGSAEQRVRDYFGLATLDGLGLFSPAELGAAGLALFYVERTQCGGRPKLDVPTSTRRSPCMEIDAASRANLELSRTLTGTRDGSLLATLDRCETPAGARRLAAWLASPLTDRATIATRLASVGFLVGRPDLRHDVRRALRRAPDLSRATSRLAIGRGGPRDLSAVAAAARAAAELAVLLDGSGELPHMLADLARQLSAPDPALTQRLEKTLADDLPLQRRDGGFVRVGVDPELDEALKLRDESRQVIAGLQQHYCELADTRRLKVKHNNMLGYFVEVPQSLGENLMSPPLNATFIHRQTMVDAMRFSTVELSDLETRIATAGERALAREQAMFDALSAAILAAAAELDGVADALARLDVIAGLAEVAAVRDWVAPMVEESGAFVIAGGRHPVVEAALATTGEPFIANNCDLSADVAGGRIAVVTGPNMGGKSTFLRQNALIAILAQMGSFVPATSARIGIVDRVFSRVGAADDLARGRSTFMVEMVETAAILNQATPRSLVILDEIGRGTATFDGLSIAWAVMEHLHDRNRSRAIFATHFHELTQLSRRLPRLVNLTTRVADWKGDVVFLHEVVPGAADRSYGIQVAKLAGLPATVVRRARSLLAELEAGDRAALSGRLLSDLPLFSAAPAAVPDVAETGPHPLFAALAEVEPDQLTPREALDALYRLKGLAAS